LSQEVVSDVAGVGEVVVWVVVVVSGAVPPSVVLDGVTAGAVQAARVRIAAARRARYLMYDLIQQRSAK